MAATRRIMPAMRTHEEPAISVEGLVKSFGDVRALDGVDLEVAPGTVLGVLGPSGAGKTTMVRVLTALLAPDAGTARVAGLDVVADAARLRSLAGRYPAVDENLTGAENLMRAGRRAEELLERFSLTEAGDRPVRAYSGGMRRRLDLAAALVAAPPVLFLDEPTTGLDPRSRLALRDTLEDLVAGGTTVLLTTQDLEEAARLADRIAVVDHGRVIAEGTAEELKRRVGGQRVEITLTHEAAAFAATIALAGMSDEPVHVDGALVSVPVREREGAVMEAARRLVRAGVGASDVTVREPTLDDVLRSLTRQPELVA